MYLFFIIIIIIPTLLLILEKYTLVFTSKCLCIPTLHVVYDVCVRDDARFQNIKVDENLLKLFSHIHWYGETTVRIVCVINTSYWCVEIILQHVHEAASSIELKFNAFIWCFSFMVQWAAKGRWKGWIMKRFINVVAKLLKF